MKCESTTELLTQYLLGDLPPNVSDEIRLHLQDCDGCRAEATDIESTLELLSDALATTQEAAPANLESAHYAKIYAAGVLEPEEKEIRKSIIIHVGDWFTTYHHQLAAAAAMIFIGGMLLAISMPMCMKTKSSARRHDELLGGSAPRYGLQANLAPAPVEELDEIEEIVLEDSRKGTIAFVARKPASAPVEELEPLKHKVGKPIFVGTPKTIKSDNLDSRREGQVFALKDQIAEQERMIAELEEVTEEKDRELERMNKMIGEKSSEATLTSFSPKLTPRYATMGESPVIMKGIYGSRSPGAGMTIKGYGGNVADTPALYAAMDDNFHGGDDIDVSIDFDGDGGGGGGFVALGYSSTTIAGAPDVGDAKEKARISLREDSLPGGDDFFMTDQNGRHPERGASYSRSIKSKKPQKQELAEPQEILQDAMQEVPTDLYMFADLKVANGPVEDISTFEKVEPESQSKSRRCEKRLVKGKRKTFLREDTAKEGAMEEARGKAEKKVSGQEGMALGALVTESEDILSDLLEATHSSFAATGVAGNVKPEHREQDGKSNLGRAGMSLGEIAAGSGTIIGGVERRAADPTQAGHNWQKDTKATSDGKGDKRRGKQSDEQNERWNSTPNDVNNLMKAVKSLVDASYVMEVKPTSGEIDKGYTIKRGDTLSAIAAKHDVSVKELADANGIANADHIQVGSKLALLTAPEDKKLAPSTNGDFIALKDGESPEGNKEKYELFKGLGVPWPQGSSVKYLPSVGKLMVANEPAPKDGKEKNKPRKPLSQDEKREKVLNKLESVIIPEIDFRNANINDVVAFLGEISQEFDSSDSDGGELRGANIILNVGQNYDDDMVELSSDDPFAAMDAGFDDESSDQPNIPLITFKAKDISLKDALKIVAEYSNLRYHIKNGTVMLVEKNYTCEEMIPRWYSLDKDFIAGVKQYDSTLLNAPAPKKKALQGSDWKDFFGGLGVPWPNGSKINYDKDASTLTMVNTEDNLQAFENTLNQFSFGDEPKPTPDEVRAADRRKRNKEIREEKLATAEKQMNSIVIPEIDFRQAHVADIVHFLNEMAEEYNPGQKNIPLVLEKSVLKKERPHPDDPFAAMDEESDTNVPLVTFQARDLTMLDAVKIVTEYCNLNYTMENGRLQIQDKSVPIGEIITRTYNVMNFDDVVRESASLDEEADRTDWKKAFADMGVAWPAGTKIVYLPEIGKLMIANTAENLQKAEGAIETLSDAGRELTGPKFKAFGVNPFVSTKDNAFSTFAIDVDTASYTLARNYMKKGFLPPAESVRTEEFVNFFDYDYAPAKKGMFKIYTECAPSKFGRGLHMLKIGVKGKAIGRQEKKNAILTFAIDSSGSMNQRDRIGLVRKSFKLLLEELDPADEIAIVQFGSKAHLVLEHTPAFEKEKILAAVKGLQISGSTNLEEAMLLAYRTAAKEFKPGHSNRVIVMSDGAANIGEGAADQILSKIEQYSKQGIFCSIFGYGIGTYNDEMLETLANKGNGTYSFIDSEDEARRVFVDELSATLHTIASDVKIQVEFDPGEVKRYRQLGYENRQLTKKQFRDDTVDAGEVGSGQAVTALYETELSGRPELYGRRLPRMAIVRVRYRRVDTGAIEEIEKVVYLKNIANSFEKASSKFKLACGVAEFAEILRGSPHAKGSEYNDAASVARPIALEFNMDQRILELRGMLENAGGMSRGELESRK